MAKRSTTRPDASGAPSPAPADEAPAATAPAKKGGRGGRLKGAKSAAPEGFFREMMTDIITDPRKVHEKHTGADRLFEMLIEAPGELAALLWTPNPHFSAFLRAAREGAGLSIRQVAPHLGVSAAYISRLETGGYASAPSIERLVKMADLYSIPRQEMLTQAGIRVDVPPDAMVKDTTEAEFAEMLMDQQLRPTHFAPELLHYVPARLKRQWIEWAIKLTAQENPREFLMNLIHKAQQS